MLALIYSQQETIAQLNNTRYMGQSNSTGNNIRPIMFHTSPSISTGSVQSISGPPSSNVVPGQETVLSHALSAMTLQDPSTGAWNMDTCTSSYLNDFVHSLSDVLNMCLYPSIFVGDGYTIFVTNTGHSILPTPHHPLHLNNVLITPYIVKILNSACQSIHDNYYTVEFDAFGFSMKDFMTRRVLLRCNSMGDL
ncbi:hypothetical protein Tco_0127396 [Tanacetum coccineum]